MNGLLRVSRAIDTLSTVIGKGVSWCGLVGVVICTGNAIVRYAFNISSNGWLEIQWYLNSAMFMLVAAYALKQNAHVRIDVIGGKLSPRIQAWIDIFGGIFMLLPTVTIIAWYSIPSLVNSFQLHEMSSDSGVLVRWPVRLLIPVAFGNPNVGLPRRILTNRYMLLLGVISYSLFLWHEPLLLWLGNEGLISSGGAGFAKNLGLAFGLTIVASVATYVLVEAPALRLRFHRSREPVPPEQVEAAP
jgi:TRAP-type mannitol/chloroaromatic compound transport system permease small subunit